MSEMTEVLERIADSLDRIALGIGDLHQLLDLVVEQGFEIDHIRVRDITSKTDTDDNPP